MRMILGLAVTIIVNWTASSQSVTSPRDSNDTNYVTVSKVVAREIAKELVRKDLLVEENKLLLDNNIILKKTVELKDSLLLNRDLIIYVYKQKDTAYNRLLSLKDLQVKEYRDLSIELNKDLKKANNRRAWTSTLSIIGMVATFMLSVLR